MSKKDLSVLKLKKFNLNNKTFLTYSNFKSYLEKSINKKPIVPSANEIKENPPSRSAKLRYVIKKEDFYNFETDILEKFDYLIKIENFSQKL